jgi:hypothetical protein
MAINLRLLAGAMLYAAYLGQAVSLPPPPGRIVDVGGRKLHLHCTGAGGPTVVIEAGASSFAALRQDRLAQPHPLGDRPLVVLSRGINTNAERDASFAEITRLSSNSRHAVVPNADHEIHLYAPPAVIQAVHDVVTAVRTKAKLAAR